MTQPPHELEFVLKVPSSPVREHADFDVHLPEGDRLPAVVIVPGPSPAAYPIRPRQWPLFTGYAQLLASRGVAAVVVDQPYHSPAQAPEIAEALPGIIESVRALDEIDADRIAVWAFSGGALLVGRWLEESPPWLRCLALTYPYLVTSDVEPRPGRPLIVTRVGKEAPEFQTAVDRLLDTAKTTGTEIHVIDVPNGHHGFDCVDHTDESQQAVRQAADFVVTRLSRSS